MVWRSLAEATHLHGRTFSIKISSATNTLLRSGAHWVMMCVAIAAVWKSL
jgi:hypothetical protein